MKRVGILRGGQGDHYEISLKKGGNIFSHIYEYLSHKWKPVDIFVDKEGIWHLGGKPVTLSQLLHQIDVVWNESHPSLGHEISRLGIPVVGPSLFSHGIRGSRRMLEEHIRKMEGIKMPRHIIFPVYQEDMDGESLI